MPTYAIYAARDDWEFNGDPLVVALEKDGFELPPYVSDHVFEHGFSRLVTALPVGTIKTDSAKSAVQLYRLGYLYDGHDEE